MSANLKKFNKVMDALIQSIIRLCPNETNVKVGYEYFKMCPSKKIWELFITNVYPYRAMIVEKNDEFFLKSKVNKDKLSENVSEKVGGESAFNSILNIKEAWKNDFSEVDKEKIWKALLVLVKLSEKISMEELQKSKN